MANKTHAARLEAEMLSYQTGLRWQACLAWMHHKGFETTFDAYRAYRMAAEMPRDIAIAAIQGEIEDLILGR